MSDRNVSGSLGVETHLRIGVSPNELILSGNSGGTSLLTNGQPPNTQVGGSIYLDPASHAYLAQTGPIEDYANAGGVTAGQIQLTKIWVPKTLPTVTNIVSAIATAVAGSPANCFSAIYTSAGTLIGVSADRSVGWATAGIDTAAIAGGPLSVTGGTGVFIWGALLVGTGTTITFGQKRVQQGAFPNAGLTAATCLASILAGGLSSQTSMPASFTPASSSTACFGPFWMAVS